MPVMTEGALITRPVLPAKSGPVLSVRGLEAWYGESHILQGMNFDLYPGEVITLLGRNGAGKTTTLRAIMGILAKRRGSVIVEGTETIGLPSRYIARLGVGYCPEERGIFSSLSVEENLMLPPKIKAGRPRSQSHLPAVSQPQGTASKPGYKAFRRRAADACHRAHLENRRSHTSA